VPQAQGKVGPPLANVGSRGIIGGRLENKPDNLRRWIEHPQAVSPGTTMPDLGVTPADARDISAFLYTNL
jgi:cytochrome c1